MGIFRLMLDFSQYYHGTFINDLKRFCNVSYDSEGRISVTAKPEVPFRGAFKDRDAEMFFATAYEVLNATQAILPVGGTMEKLDFSYLGKDLRLFLSKVCSSYQFKLSSCDALQATEKEIQDTMGSEFRFEIFKNGIPDCVYKEIVNQFHREAEITEEIRSIESMDLEDAGSNGPVPDGHYFGICEVSELSTIENSEELDLLLVSISMPDVKQAVSLICKILKNAEIQYDIEIRGAAADHDYRIVLNYSYDQSVAKLKRFYDNTPELVKIIAQVNEKFGTKFDYESDDGVNGVFPRDDAETIAFFQKGEFDGMFLLTSEDGREYLTLNPEINSYDDLARAHLGAAIPGKNPDEFMGMGRLIASDAYDLAYLMVHYGVKIDTEEEIYEIE